MNYIPHMERYSVETYVDESGVSPFELWVHSIKDRKARLAISARIDRAAFGDFGDWKPIRGAKGVSEMRIHYAQGFRIYFTVIGRRIVLLLVGSAKQDQDRGIERARKYLARYKETER